MIFRDDRLAMPLEPRTGIRLVAHGRVDVFEPQGTYQLYVDCGPAGRHRRARDAPRGAQGAARGRGAVRGEPQAAAAAVAADDRHLHVALGRRPPRHPRRHRATLAARAHRRELVPRPGARSRRLDRPRAAADRALDRPRQRTRGRRRHPRARWRVARGPLGVQRGSGRARGLRASPADRRRRGPRVGHDARGVRRRRPRGHAVGRCRAGHAGPGRARPTPRTSGVDAHPERASPPCRGPRIARGRGTRARRARGRVRRSRPNASARACCSTARRGSSSDGSTALGARSRRCRDGSTRRSRPGRASPGSRSTRSGASLAALSPYATLERGYAIVRDGDGHVVTQARSQAAGAALDVLLAQGALHVRVEHVRDSRT